jgi:SAM-dependent methyltransferase
VSALSTPLLARRCEVCGSGQVRLLRHSEHWSFDVGRCGDCGMAWVLNPPPPKVEKPKVEGVPDWEWYIDAMRDDDSFRVAVLDRIRSILDPGPGVKPVLFDVGAGVGDFVVLANEHGFAAGGNDISPRGIAMAKERHGLELSPLVLANQPPASVDAITMWCVLAHVNEPRTFLREAFAMLKPGGVLFLRTPRWCVVDTAGQAMSRFSGGSAHRIADRRITTAHMHMYNAKNMTRQLEAIGFDDIAAEPECHFPWTTDAYLSTGSRAAKIASRFGPVIDKLIERRWFVRNTLLVYARRATGRSDTGEPGTVTEPRERR